MSQTPLWSLEERLRNEISSESLLKTSVQDTKLEKKVKTGNHQPFFPGELGLGGGLSTFSVGSTAKATFKVHITGFCIIVMHNQPK
jgi:hypothetical protein